MSIQASSKRATQFGRGFKTWAENTSLSIRSRLGLGTTDPLPAPLLAKHLGVRLWALDDVPGLPSDTLDYLSTTGSDEWSAVSVRVGVADIVVFNSTHSKGRQSSDIMHELSHIIRGHEPAQVYVSPEIGVGIRSFNPIQEAEADWLAGCLLLPRPALIKCMASGMPVYQVCQSYSVSGDLYTYRQNITGVKNQVARAVKYRRK